MAGIPPAGVDRAACRATFVANLRRAAETAATRGITLLVEPINTRDIRATS
jgi:hydroxypyruvate isomerase